MSEKDCQHNRWQSFIFLQKIRIYQSGVEISIIILKGHSMGVSVFCGEGGEPGLEFGGVF